MKVTKVPLDKLKRPAKNVRRHSQKQIEEFVRSVNMFGQIRPIVVDENYTMLAGNGLYEALLQTGATEADCYVVVGLSDAKKKKLMLADNRIFNLGADNLDVFDEIIAELGADIDIPGYDEELLRTLNASEADIDQMIMDYGKFDAEARQTMQARAETMPSPTPAASAPQEAAFQPSQPQNNIGHSFSAPPLQTPFQPASSENDSDARFILCPHCGWRIELAEVV